MKIFSLIFISASETFLSMVKYLSSLFNPKIQKIPNKYKYVSKSHKLFTYYNLVSSSTHGIYTIMPIFQRSIDKLISLINTNMSFLGAEKITMPSLCKLDLWKQSGRHELMQKDLLTLRDNDNDLLLQPTHEEEVTNLLSNYSPLSEKKFPILLYQISPKFRNEMYPKSGIIRGREFLMKDLYSFDQNEEKAEVTYSKVIKQYNYLLSELELNVHCVRADSGNMGGQMSHEFQLESESGNDKVYVCSSCKLSFGSLENTDSCPVETCSGKLEYRKTIELAHCFLLGTRYSEAFNLHFKDSIGEKKFVYMGCYGIGVTRLIGAAVDVLSTDEQIRWPRKIAPFHLSLLMQKSGAKDEVSEATKEKFIQSLCSSFSHAERNLDDILVDDTNSTIGGKYKYSDSLGIPWSIVVKDKSVFEIVDNYNGIRKHLSMQDCIDIVTQDLVFKTKHNLMYQ